MTSFESILDLPKRESHGMKVPWFWKTKADVPGLRRRLMRLPFRYLAEPDVRYAVKVLLWVMQAPDDVPSRELRVCATDVSLSGIDSLITRLEVQLPKDAARHKRMWFYQI